MTKQRPDSWICSNSGCPHESAKSFNNWIRDNLPDSSTGFLVSDLDLILYNYKTRKVMLLEVKTRGTTQKEWQRLLFAQLDEWIRAGIISSKTDRKWEYLGYHLIMFEKTSFNNGRCYLDHKEISQEDLREYLSMIK